MAYTKQTWTNDDPDTPLSGPRMSHIEDGLEAAHEAIDGLEFSDIGGTASSGQIPSLAIAKITGLQAALDGKADDPHDHDGQYATPAQVSAKADADHSHDLDDVTGLQAALDGKADADHDHDGVYATPAQVNAKADADHSHDIDDVSGLQAALNAITNRLDALEGDTE